MFKITKKIASFFKLCFHAHHNQLDVIRFEREDRYSFDVIRKCYLFVLVLFLIGNAYCTLGLECESRPSCSIDLKALPTSPFYCWHQMWIRAAWTQIDMLAITLTIFSITAWIGFLFNAPIGRRFLIYTEFDHKNRELEHLYTFRKRFLKFSVLMESTINFWGFIFLYTHVLFVNAVYNVNVTSFMYWFLFNPLVVYFDILFLYVVPLYIILASKYITIQQKELTNKLIKINTKLIKIQKPRSLKRIWQEYIFVNGKICNLSAHVQEYARFWSPFLTTLFGAYITIECYVFYVCLFVDDISLVLRAILWMCFAGLVFNEFVLINYCAMVVTRFKRITLLNRTFFRWYGKIEKGGPTWQRNLVKAENLQDSRLLHSYAFRLFGNYRITSKSFHIIISYISIFFLYLVQNF